MLLLLKASLGLKVSTPAANFLFFFSVLASCFCPFHVSLLPVPTLFFQGQGMLPYFANFRLLAEFSTPCVNQRYVPCLGNVQESVLTMFLSILF